MDYRVNCMACLVADEEGALPGAVVTKGAITHALARTGSNAGAHHLCAFDDTGTMRRGKFWESRVGDDEIEW